MRQSSAEDLYETVVRRGFRGSHADIDRCSRLYVEDYPLQSSMYEFGKERSGHGLVTNPFLHIVPVTDNPPPQMYDSSVPATWVYPIWKYLYDVRDKSDTSSAGGHYDVARDSHRRYSNFKTVTYMAGEMDYYMQDVNRAVDNCQHWRDKYYCTSPYRKYGGHPDLRHFGGFRSNSFTTMTSINPWK
ncbi:unnamed protein product [Soboliphyme baturini]|uniref:Sulfatase domain-containing protein n=1 Tax=Soboliphyme baturini TaxID=241478 RepID=A0A183IQN6_9BILA|nr:unnamed protein product [Soboliphyme baturini]